MAEVTETETPSGNTHTTVVTEGERSGGSGATWLILLVVLVLAVVGIWFFSGWSSSETSKNNAIANAADNVGAAAQKAGDAAEGAANSSAN